MLLSEGNKVSYPLQGPCLIGPVVTKVIGGERTDFHHLIPLGEGGAELFVPFGQVPAQGVRRLLYKSEIPAVLDRLKQPAPADKNWRQRAADHVRLFASGLALDLAQVIASLTAMRRMNRLATNDVGTLERARRMLIREIAEVTGESDRAAEASIDEALAEAHDAAVKTEAPRPRKKARSAA
jgi:RNA polymerase-interacting CarD/CdnL/TRCF family regulator